MKRRKNTLLALVLIVCMLFVFTACGGNDDSSENSDDDSMQVNEKIVIKFAHVETEDRSVHKSIQEFEEYVEDKTNGQVDVQIFPNAQLGGERQCVESVSLGTLQMTAASTAVLTSYDETFAVLDLPFLFKDRKTAYNACDGELGETLNALLPDYNMVSLGYQDNGLRHISNSVRPIYKVEDLKGLKIRVMENPLYIDLFKSLGANPTPMSFGEVYTALQQGTVDAQENGASLVYSSKFHEVQQYYSKTGHVYSFNIVVSNKDFFDKLPEDVQVAIQEGAKTYLVDEQREMEGNSDADFLEKLASEGMEVNEIAPENREEFIQSVKPVYDSYAEKLGPEIIKLAQEFNE